MPDGTPLVACYRAALDGGRVSLFVQAKNYTPGPRTRGAVRLIVVHDMESPETVHTAEDCAQFFAGPNAPRASCHWAVDSDSEVGCVHEEDIAWHCPGANHDGIGIEHAGYARQSRDEWLDAYGILMLRRSAALIVSIAERWGIPLVWLDADGVAAGAAGITTHRACTEAFHTAGGHTDPGPDFPADVLMGFVHEVNTKSKPVTEEDDDVNQEFRYGFEPSFATNRPDGTRAIVEVDAREGAIRGYHGVAFEPRDLMDGDPEVLSAIDVSGGKLNGGPVRFTIRNGDTVTFVTQGGNRYALTAVAP